MTIFKRGDIVAVQGEVRYNVDHGDEYVYVRFGHNDAGVRRAELTLITPKFEVGDLATFEGRQVEIKATIGDQVWIAFGGFDADQIVNAGDLERMLVATDVGDPYTGLTAAQAQEISDEAAATMIPDEELTRASIDDVEEAPADIDEEPKF
jgi:hypothetical protein